MRAATAEPSENLLSYFAVPVPPEFAKQVAAALQRLPFVELAYIEEEVILPAVNFADDPLVVGQGYFGAAPFGVDAFQVWTHHLRMAHRSASSTWSLLGS